MKKGKNKRKKVIAISVDEEVNEKINKLCKENALNKSALVEKMFIEYLQKHKAI